MRLASLFRKNPAPERAVYEAIVAAARHPVFYAEWGVPDSVDGRFDMLALHMFLVLDRLKGLEADFRQRLTDAFFADMDRSLREMGVGDLSVGKKVRKMAEAFYGRVAAYDAALAAGVAELVEAIRRNVFPGNAATSGAAALAAYVLSQKPHLAAQPTEAIAAGRIALAAPEPRA